MTVKRNLSGEKCANRASSTTKGIYYLSIAQLLPLVEKNGQLFFPTKYCGFCDLICTLTGKLLLNGSLILFHLANIAIYGLLFLYFRTFLTTHLTAHSGETDDTFGNSVAVYGQYSVIGSKGCSVTFTNQGCVFVFFQQSSVWKQQAKLVATNSSQNNFFGHTVSIIDDLIIIGVPYYNIEDADGGAAYMFNRTESSWSQQTVLFASDGSSKGFFGQSASLSGDYALIGAPYIDIEGVVDQGAVYVFLRSDTIWSQQIKLIAADGATSDSFGWSVSLSGDYAAIGATGHSEHGACYVFKRNASDWIQQAKLSSGASVTKEDFGWSVSIDGDFLVVGAPQERVNSQYYQGAVYAYHRNNSNWDQQTKLVSSDGKSGDSFGYSVSISDNRILVGAYYDKVGVNISQGSSYVFQRTADDWGEVDHLIAGSANDYFGYSVAIYGNYAVIGAPYDDIGSNADQGSAYIFTNVTLTDWALACPIATHISGGSCQECATGTYNDLVGQSTCLNCAAGTYNSVTGSDSSSACLACDPGKYNLEEGQASCYECGLGKYNPDAGSVNESSCMNCSAGTYNDQTGQSSCTNCSTGKYNSMIGQSDCAACPAGKYAELEGLNECYECPIDFFQPSINQDSCAPCGIHTCTNMLTGQESCSLCPIDYNITSVFGCVDDNQEGSTYDCPTTGNVTLKITVQGLIVAKVTDVIAGVGGSLCPVVSILSPSKFQCVLPPGVGADVSVFFIDKYDFSASANSLSYTTADADYINGCDDSEALPHPDGTSACSRDGSDEVTVSGNNFGPDQASVLVGGVKATLIPLSSRGLSGWEQNTTIVRVPSGSGLSVGVNVLQKGGELSDGVRMLSYKPCDPGFYNLRNDSTGIFDCVECSLGYYNLAYESFSCELCPSGSYCSTSSISSCDSILSGSSSPSGSFDSSDCVCLSNLQLNGGSCVCPPGFEYNPETSSCLSCGIGEYKDSSSLDGCFVCSDIFSTTLNASSVSSSSCICKPLFVDVNSSEFDTNCIECPSGMICDDSGSVLTSISLETGYWRESSTDLST